MGNHEDHQSNSEFKHSPDDNDVPLWLQGLEDKQKGDTQPLSNEGEEEGTWIREIEHIPPLEDFQPFENEEDSDQDRVLPEWFEGINDDSDHISDGEDALRPDDQPQEDNQKIHFPEDHSKDRENSANYLDLSDSKLGETNEIGLQPPEEESISDEELPGWLQEMITEPPQSEDHSYNAGEEMITSTTEDTTDPLEITQEIPVEDSEEIVQPTPAIQEEREISPEKEVFPVQIDSNQTEMDEIREEDPGTLNFTKQLIEQGQLDRAVKIINAQIDQLEELDELYNSLNVAVENTEEKEPGIFETIGDLARRIGDHSAAISAYTKAISSLVLAKESDNEND